MNDKEFRNLMGYFATGVTVITTKDEQDNYRGLTVNSFTSLSLDPKQILFCIDKKSSSVDSFKKKRPFVVNILQDQQESLCRHFAKRGEDKFSNIEFSVSAEGVPVVNDNLATIHCSVHEVYEGGDHLIIIGNVNDFSYDETKKPLLFYRGQLKTSFDQLLV